MQQWPLKAATAQPHVARQKRRHKAAPFGESKSACAKKPLVQVPAPGNRSQGVGGADRSRGKSAL
eukprot:CAMPEP_0203920994 /NCGR_PEP_ID=MMETSP0359-20131031/61215_1 /ASSEMBLY_ACC=CAM_ASM_000338 /TAXON_ID=268821 /ORGANISM="Scrippsiella Hangoei, Strain SHTV-5" /LENGTH=64 /DNA_ID=CAMNT_0050848601 /DNA_START=134 /DNA_END=328 /DNA_ORIENTATION=-